MPFPPALRWLTLAAAAALALTRCSLEEDFLRDPGTTIRFSADTLSFDTVFTAVGSATRSFKIYNPHARPLSLASVRVESANGGRFRINVDGLSGTELTDVYVGPEDSIYVFAEVTVDPDQDVSASPFVLEGRVVVRAVDEEQSILLVAFGQNANYLPLDRQRAGFRLLACELGEVRFDDPKPYVLYGSLIVDSCTLVLPEGCRLYVHGGLVRGVIPPDTVIYNDGLVLFTGRGRLRVEGTAERPVVIAGDRLEESFRQRAGQWSGIRLLAGTGPHAIAHARIRGGILGVFVDSAARLSIANTELSYLSTNGLIGYASAIDARNVAIHSTGGTPFQGVKGGRYTLDYCTVVSLSGRSAAVELSTGVTLPDNRALLGPLEFRIRNSIVYSSNRDALALPDYDRPDLRTYAVRNNVVRIDELRRQLPGFEADCVDCVFAQPSQPLFRDVQRDSFQLDSMSIALGRAQPLPELPRDLLDRERDGERPDVGAYEFLPE